MPMESIPDEIKLFKIFSAVYAYIAEKLQQTHDSERQNQIEPKR